MTCAAGPALQSQYQLRSREDFEAVTGAKSPAGKRYFKHTRLADIVGAYPLRDGMSDAEVPAWWSQLCRCSHYCAPPVTAMSCSDCMVSWNIACEHAWQVLYRSPGWPVVCFSPGNMVSSMDRLVGEFY